MRWLLGLLFLYAGPAAAVTGEEVVRSSLEHFPKVIEAVQELEIETNTLKSIKGGFDAKIKGEVNARESGYYDGDVYELGVEKPIPYFNSKVFGGRRQSYGSFPSYEGKFETLPGGEDFAGFSVSLLRNALIDQNRFNIRYQRQSVEQAEISLESVKVNVQTMALKAYWTWLIKGNEMRVLESILQLAEARASQLKKRIRAGDLAPIYLAENNQYIIKRKSQLLQKRVEFQEASFYLSLFYRDSRGQPRPVGEQNLPLEKDKDLNPLTNTDEVVGRALSASLRLRQLESMEKQADLDLQLGRNDVLPALDFKYEWSQDRGLGPDRLSQQENRVMLALEIPIEYRKGLGKMRAARAKLNQVKVKKKWTEEKVKVEAQSLLVKLNTFAEVFKMTKDQVELAEKLAQAERKKFSRGASDLILVNIREETLAEAQIKNLSFLLKYQFLDADLKQLLVQMIQ